jgi:hypothetical protein
MFIARRTYVVCVFRLRGVYLSKLLLSVRRSTVLLDCLKLAESAVPHSQYVAHRGKNPWGLTCAFTTILSPLRDAMSAQYSSLYIRRMSVATSFSAVE